jgi:hypothetical protein
VQGVPVDSALRTAFGLPNGVVARLQSISEMVAAHYGNPAVWAQIPTIYATAHKYWHPHYPASVP